MTDDYRLVKEELCDPDMLDAILKDDRFSKSDKGKLSAYKRQRTFGNKHEVVYQYGRGCEQFELGRLYAAHNAGLQAFSRDIRNPLLAKHYWDLDIENCHYNLITKLASDWGTPVPNCKYYTDNREACLAAISPNRQTAKVALLKIAYGGSLDPMDFDYPTPSDDPTDLRLLQAIEKEMILVRDACWNHQSDEYKLLAKRKSRTKIKKDPKSVLLALILQTEERKCLLCLDEFLKTKDRSLDVLIHDGGCVRKLPDEMEFPKSIMIEAEKAIFDQTGYDLTLTIKPLDHTYQVPEEGPLVNDRYAAEKFVEFLGDRIVYCAGQVYYFDRDRGMWGCGERDFQIALSSVAEHMILRGTDYSGNLRNIKNMRPFISALLPETNFIEDGIARATGKLLFQNGTYYFDTDDFSESFDPSLVFIYRIERPYKPASSALMRRVNQILFVHPFTVDDTVDDTPAGLLVKKYLALGLYGQLIKALLMGLGFGDTGKSTLIKAIQAATCGYSGIWNANQLLYSRSDVDPAKKLAWLADFQGRRLAFSSEISIKKGTAIDSSLIKSIASGGDTLHIRTNFRDQWPIINRALVVMLANDLPDVRPQDSAVQNRCKTIRWNVTFSDKPDPDQRRNDPNISKFLADNADALLFLLIHTYQSMTDAEKRGKLDNSASDTTEVIGNDTDDFADLIEQNYDITNNPDDFVPFSEIKALVDRDLTMSANLIGRSLSKLIKLPNGQDSASRQGRVRGRIGLKSKRIKLNIRPRFNPDALNELLCD